MRFVCTLLLFAAPSFAVDYAAWAGRNRSGSWTKAAEIAVAEVGLSASTPSDVMKFCPNYHALASTDRSKFWVGLLSAIAQPESGFNPTIRHVEKFGDKFESPAISRGLLQISFGTAMAPRHGCGVRKASDLERAETNLACGARILSTWVKHDGTIANFGTSKSTGGARAWPVLREKSNRFPAIMRFTKQLPFCVSAK